jgi:hypothetical protein
LTPLGVNVYGFLRALDLTQITTHTILLPGDIDLTGNQSENIHRTYFKAAHTTAAAGIVDIFNRHIFLLIGN